MDAQPQGHNSKEQLRSIIERVERLDTEIKELRDDRGDIFSEAKGAGYDLPALRAIIKLRKQDANKVQEHDTLVDTYKQALGMS